MKTVTAAQRQQPGCIGFGYMKQFHTIDGVEPGNPPRELIKIVKCVKYFSYWQFNDKECYGKAIEWFIAQCGKDIQRLLIMPLTSIVVMPFAKRMGLD